jgi:hypothetical protein
MKGMFFSIIFLNILVNSFSQEIIWSTVQNDVIKTGQLIDRADVRNEIMQLYNKYKYYYNDGGYDIDYFLQAFGMDYMLMHLPKSASAMQLIKNGYTQVQVLVFVLYSDARISGCLIFSDDGMGRDAIETTEQNREIFEKLLDSLWIKIGYYQDDD